MRLLIGLFLFLSAADVFAQSNFDDRLLAKFDQERIADLQKNQPQILAYWSYFLDHGYFIGEVADLEGKLKIAEHSVKIKDLNSINILALDVHPDRHMSKAYKIKGTTKYLVVHDNATFSKMYNRAHPHLVK